MRLYGTLILTSVMVLLGTSVSASMLTAHAYLQAQPSQSSLIDMVNFDSVAASKQAEKTISDLGEQAISTLNTETDSAKRSEIFDRVLNDKFDMNTIARFSLGRYWSIATPSEQKQYVRLFNEMIVDVYSGRFEDYSGQKFTVKGSKPVGRKDILVNSLILSPNGQSPVKVDWRVRNGRIIDVVVEGVSMSVTQRSEFNSIIQRNGGKIAALIAHLEK